MTDQVTNEVNNESMMQRIERLLARAEDFRRHGEDGSADAALALAEQIMLKYSIDESVIAARLAAGAEPTDEIVVAVLPFTGIYRKALVMQFIHLVRAYTNTIKSFMSKDGTIENVHLAGFKNEVDQLVALVTSIHLQAVGRMRKWWDYELSDVERTSGMDGYKARRQYLSSFVQGATDRIATARRAAVAQAVAQDAGTALALRSRADQVDAFLAANYNLTTVRTRLKPGSGDAAAAGYRDGQQANTGEQPVGSNRRQIGT